MKSGDRVIHSKFGPGTVLLDQGQSAVVRFAHGIEECEKGNLKTVTAPTQVLLRADWDVPLEVVSRAQALAIRSTNDTWGVFSRSRMELLPHQLWVCRKVNQAWPARWLVADDVGLGKTIEAGMILYPLLSRGIVKRVLVICPASLVDQWQYRFRTMFDIRLTKFTPDADTPRSDFWNTHNQVVASLQTLRMKNEARRQRLVESDPWDLVLVDEAHHLNADEQEGLTLGYKLVKALQDEKRVHSMVFFTGTPHRGKNFGFLSLLQLLRPELFDPLRPLGGQLQLLPEVMIRNNKSTVTDLRGNRLFQKPEVTSETYHYSQGEAKFYSMLTQFILQGQAYASTLSQTEGQAVMLVLIAMQKLASSSVAAIRRALSGRLSRLLERRGKIESIRNLLSEYREAERNGLQDELSKAEEELPALEAALRLVENEESSLRALLSAAEEVGEETKIRKIIDLVDGRFRTRSVLFFTEYKATQSLLMGALIARFGEGCVTFINGDDQADDVRLPSGNLTTVRLPREDAAQGFNEGRFQFLVATEAGGEGIDLQESCHTLVHVDLPWNPMRLHQRVGRLNRYGQRNRVEVVMIRNPDTVESRIWDKLNEKLERITLALGHVMDEPEDMLQMVLGMTSPSLFRDLFAEGVRVPRDSVGRWFDQRAASFGGQDAVRTVLELVGHAARFDFREVCDRLPKVDLPDLKPFMEGALLLNGRRPKYESDEFSFLTPEVWRTEPAVRSEYRGMRFERSDRSPDAAKRLLGVGHAVVDQAIRQALDRSASLVTVPFDVLSKPLFMFSVRDRVTEHVQSAKIIFAGVEFEDSKPVLLRDWEVLKILNGLPLRREFMSKISPAHPTPEEVENMLFRAEEFLHNSLQDLEESFRLPAFELEAVVWPRRPQAEESTETEIGTSSA